jgi:L-malate glycosyltransferase
VKIAIVSTMSGHQWGGSEYLWAAMAEHALSQGHEVFISIYDWSVNRPEIISLQQKGARLLPRNRFTKITLTSRIFRKIRKKFPTFSSLYTHSKYQDIINTNPDVICINQGHTYEGIYEQDLIAWISATLTPYLIVSQLNTESFGFHDDLRQTAQKLFGAAAHHIFVSHQNLKLTERQIAMSLTNGLVLQNPVNLTDLSLVPWQDKSPICFASVARLDVNQKGQDVLFEVLSYPIWQERDWRLNLYGSGSDREYLEALAQHYGIANRVKFKGHVSDIRKIWSDNDMLLLPSREEGGPPIVLVEAMLCGRPIVATNVGAVTEWLEDNQTGFIAEALTPKLFSAALERAWVSQKDWEQMGIRGHEFAISKFDPHPGKSLLDTILSIVR